MKSACCRRSSLNCRTMAKPGRARGRAGRPGGRDSLHCPANSGPRGCRAPPRWRGWPPSNSLPAAAGMRRKRCRCTCATRWPGRRPLPERCNEPVTNGCCNGVANGRIRERMSKRTILVVEDDRAIREMIAFSLKRAGFRCVEAADVSAARRAIADDHPDLILLDWMLPDVSGIELARALRREELLREIPIIMLTARADEDDKVRGFESGADDYITKPFSARELVARISAVL